MLHPRSVHCVPLLIVLVAASPATTRMAPSTVPVDRSTVRGAVRALWEGIRSHDVSQVADSLEASGPAPQEFTAAVARFLVAGKALSDATSERYGQSGRPIGKTMLDFDHLDQAIGKLQITESGDTATAVGENQNKMEFHRTDGQWRLVVSDFANGKPGNQPQQITLLNDLTAAIEDVAGQIRSGRFQTPQEAKRVIQDHLHAVMMDRYHASSMPATNPSTRP